MQKAEARVGTLQAQQLALTNQKAVVDAVVDTRKLTLLTILTLGSGFLLFANLMSTRESPSAAKREALAEPAASASD